ncbi:MAG TPA: 50S ribosomal protein L9 [Gammaproteobacteria bacterium]|nr:50S ribosomal protein L9 [Gammaproteobacteria bacterium]
MDVILLNKVENLGNLGDMVSVKPGYGRNYLIPSGRAVLATPENRKAFEERRAELEKAVAEALAAAEARRSALSELSVTITHKAGEEGKLFGSVGTAEIAEAVTAAGVEIKKQEVRLPAGPIRQVGEFDIELHLHPEVNVTIKVEVEPEE